MSVNEYITQLSWRDVGLFVSYLIGICIGIYFKDREKIKAEGGFLKVAQKRKAAIGFWFIVSALLLVVGGYIFQSLKS